MQWFVTGLKGFRLLAFSANGSFVALSRLSYFCGVNSTNMAGRQKLIIDCDAGVDDAMSILLALGSKDADLLAVTCVHGNTILDNVTRNVQRVLRTCGREDVPVFRGARDALMGSPERRGTHFHGSDGLGGVPDSDPPDPSGIQSEHAVSALIRLSKEHEGEIILNPVGPLTNIALAIRMDPNFTKRLKEIVIMGGNVTGIGAFGELDQYALQQPEFNFVSDPEAAHVVLQEAECPVMVVPFQTCYSTHLSWDWFDKWTSKSTKVSEFVKAIHMHNMNLLRNQRKIRFYSCDPCSTVVALQRASVLKSRKDRIVVETGQGLGRGVMMELTQYLRNPKTGPLIEVVLKIDSEMFKQSLEQIMDYFK